MKPILFLLVFLVSAPLSFAHGQRSFTTEANITPTGKPNEFLVVGSVSEIIDRNGTTSEKLIAAPRLTIALGNSATVRSIQSDTTTVKVEVSLPASEENGQATCVVTLQAGKKTLSTSKFKFIISKP